ncbi:MAG: tripartite tricarboxylate transporter TctB family protein [Aestuariivita sp.]|nr:tripartite tricarboxylate transporter TctB family protein [Aestuariivita sp.]MCY4201255.1 tripartite tricarboxylate transporter TctB family protein [Aestuariivita sp.]MCY4288377.1 tripartite tricarboxylate transporter TctB family protein [Aestuariivita sp.]MCY4346377.1 tripartite tricarboxylate transporter TctB family protein [Aestuariivita sp.]
MTNRVPDIGLGATLAILAAIWTWWVMGTIPQGLGDGEIGARAFPLTFGIILLLLAVILMGRRILSSPADGETEADGSQNKSTESGRLKRTPALLLLAEIVLYGFLLEKIGFVLATPIVVLMIMIVHLRIRSIPKLVAMPFGLTLGCWVIFEKILGIYLANGTWFNIG